MWGILSNKKAVIDDVPTRFKITTTGFNVTERNIIADWFSQLVYTGAQYTADMKRDTTYLLVRIIFILSIFNFYTASKPDIASKKYATALEWGTQIVNIEWAFNCILHGDWGFSNESLSSKLLTSDKLNKNNHDEAPNKTNFKHSFSTSLTDSLNQALRVYIFIIIIIFNLGS